MQAKKEIKYISLDSIKPYENNPRKNDEAVQYVIKSIQEFGFKVPIVIDKNNVIVTGHTRYKAAQELGLVFSFQEQLALTVRFCPKDMYTAFSAWIYRFVQTYSKATLRMILNTG